MKGRRLHATSVPIDLNLTAHVVLFIHCCLYVNKLLVKGNITELVILFFSTAVF